MNNPSVTRQRRIILALILVGLVLVGVFGWRTAGAFREVREHRPPPPFNGESAETDVELVRDWMTIPFIARAYQVPPALLFEALQIPAEGNQEKSLQQLNDEYEPRAPGIVIEKVKVALRAALDMPPARTPLPPVIPLPALP